MDVVQHSARGEVQLRSCRFYHSASGMIGTDLAMDRAQDARVALAYFFCLDRVFGLISADLLFSYGHSFSVSIQFSEEGSVAKRTSNKYY